VYEFFVLWYFVLCFVFCVLCFVFCVLCFVFCVLCFVFCENRCACSRDSKTLITPYSVLNIETYYLICCLDFTEVENVPKGMSRCEYCGELVPSVLKTDHIENRCPARNHRSKRIIKYITRNLLHITTQR
jgi:hypothetical protein